MQALDSHDHLLSLHCSYKEGAYLQVIDARGLPSLTIAFQAPLLTHKSVHSITQDTDMTWDEYWTFLSATGEKLLQRRFPYITHDAAMPEYGRQALGQPLKVFFTDPYLLKEGKIPGITCIQALKGGGGVFGSAIALSHFSRFFWNQKVSEHGSAFLFDRKARLLAHPKEPAVSVIRRGSEDDIRYVDIDSSQSAEVRAVAHLWRSFDTSESDQAQLIEIEGSRSIVKLTELSRRWGVDQVAAIVAPVSDFTGYISVMRQRTFILSVAALAVAVFLAMLLSLRVSRALTTLAGEAERV